MPLVINNFTHVPNFPTMPALLVDALQQLNGNQDISTLVDKISLDPSIVVRLLRIANSPFYGMSREIGSLHETVVLLGFNRIRDILISLCFFKMLPAQHNDFDPYRFWHHSVAVAECTRQLANLSGNNPDFAFTAGLLHDIGRLLIVVLFPKEFSQLMNESSSTLVNAEQNLLGFDHAALGGISAQHWNLPLTIQEAIAQHETPHEPGTEKSLGLLVYAANLLIVNAEHDTVCALDGHKPICTALALLNVSTDQAKNCTVSGQQFADHLITKAT